MTLAPTLGLSFAGLGLIAGGVALWAAYGNLVWFDTLATTFLGCFG